MKKYQKILLTSSAVLGLFTTQTAAADEVGLPGSIGTAASDIVLQLQDQRLSIYYEPSQDQLPYSIKHAVWTEENGQDDLVFYPGATTSLDISQHKGSGRIFVETYIEVDGQDLLLKSQAIDGPQAAAPTPAAETSPPAQSSSSPAQVTESQAAENQGGQDPAAVPAQKEAEKPDASSAIATEKKDQVKDQAIPNQGRQADTKAESTEKGTKQAVPAKTESKPEAKKAGSRQETGPKEDGNKKSVIKIGQADKQEQKLKDSLGKAKEESSSKSAGQQEAQQAAAKESKPKISISKLDTSKLTYTVTVQEGQRPIKAVKIPIWSQSDQSNIIWYEGISKGGGLFAVNFVHKNHKSLCGTYQNHVYVTYKDGGEEGFVAETVTLTPAKDRDPQISLANIKPSSFSYTVRVQERQRKIKKVQVPIWSEANQSNILWYDAVHQGKGLYTVDFSHANHQNLYGIYNNHVYVTFEDGGQVGYVADTVRLIPKADEPQLSIQKKSDSHYQITLKNSPGDGEVLFPIWSDANGQDDIVWYQTKKLGNGSYQLDLDPYEHSGSGLFHIHIYRSIKGILSGILSTVFRADKPHSPEGLLHKPDYAGAYTYPVGQCTWGAKVLAPWAGNWWGNGGQWAASARAAGFRTGSQPKVGAIVCWDDGGYGHVAVVTHVESRTRIQIKESNYLGNQYISNFRGWFDPTAAHWGQVSYIYPN